MHSVELKRNNKNNKKTQDYWKTGAINVPSHENIQTANASATVTVAIYHHVAAATSTTASYNSYVYACGSHNV